MRFGIDISPAGPWGNPRTLAELAALAERSGWDGVFLEDYIVHPSGLPTYDPWIALAAIALATERIRIGTLVTALPRRRPWKLAAEAMTLDRLSGGRLILGVGSGDPASADVARFGEPPGARERAALLDEALVVLDALWSGEPVTHHGPRFDLDAVRLLPRPVQRPRVPIWVGGQLTRRGPRQRALRWDGACLYRVPPPAWEDLTAADIAALRAEAPEPFEIVVGGRARRADEAAERAYLADIAAAGATWWHEYLAPDTPAEQVRRHIGAGPLKP